MQKNGRLRIFRNATAIITGGASGIGRSLGKALAARGCEVVLADIQYEMAVEAAAAIGRSGGKATAVALDVTDAQAVERVVNETFTRHGRLDYMFNNAGIAINGRFHDFDLKDWRRCIEINLMGVVHGVRSAHSIMAKQGFGHIVNTSSICGVYPWPTAFAYTATKHAVVGMTTSLRAELADTGIRVSVVCPGTVQTAIMENGAKPGRWVGVYDEGNLEKFLQQAHSMDPDLFAEKALQQIARNKPVIVIPKGYRMLWWINRASPRLAISLSNQISKGIFRQIEG